MAMVLFSCIVRSDLQSKLFFSDGTIKRTADGEVGGNGGNTNNNQSQQHHQSTNERGNSNENTAGYVSSHGWTNRSNKIGPQKSLTTIKNNIVYNNTNKNDGAATTASKAMGKLMTENCWGKEADKKHQQKENQTEKDGGDAGRCAVCGINVSEAAVGVGQNRWVCLFWSFF